LVIDNHPDWMRGVPFMHCGSWLNHAARLSNIRTIFHVGGDVDFDNAFRWLAPWQHLRSGKIRVLSSARHFERGAWRKLAFPALRLEPQRPTTAERIAHLLDAHRKELARWPLYVSIDKDVLTAKEAVVNWDSGKMMMPELQAVLAAFVNAAHQQ